jgi:hypothetical protein
LGEKSEKVQRSGVVTVAVMDCKNQSRRVLIGAKLLVVSSVNRPNTVDRAFVVVC